MDLQELLTENDNLRKTMSIMEEQLQAVQNKQKDGLEGDNRIEDYQAAIRKLQSEILDVNRGDRQ